MIVTPSSSVAGYRVSKTLGLARGNTIRARHIGRDLVAVFKNVVGGEIEEYTKMMAEAREQAFDRMCDQARIHGANAVISVHFSTSFIMTGAAEFLVYGTAVLLDPESDVD